MLSVADTGSLAVAGPRGHSGPAADCTLVKAARPILVGGRSVLPCLRLPKPNLLNNPPTRKILHHQGNRPEIPWQLDYCNPRRALDLQKSGSVRRCRSLHVPPAAPCSLPPPGALAVEGRLLHQSCCPWFTSFRWDRQQRFNSEAAAHAVATLAEATLQGGGQIVLAGETAAAVGALAGVQDGSGSALFPVGVSRHGISSNEGLRCVRPLPQ
ncbi:nuclear respiratory factor 1 isoform X1 [Arapaima gigas]